MSRSIAILAAFWGGFAVMVLEIAGMRLLARDFGSSFYVWTSQIGVVLVALTLGYLAGGVLADRFPTPKPLVCLLPAAGLFTVLIPRVAAPVLAAIVNRHPADIEIPRIWQKLDPAVGAAIIFLPPCLVLAMIPPFLIRLGTRAVGEVGRLSGLIYGAGSAGSIAGVFISGYWLIDWMSIPQIFRATGILIIALAGLGYPKSSPAHAPQS